MSVHLFADEGLPKGLTWSDVQLLLASMSEEFFDELADQALTKARRRQLPVVPLPAPVSPSQLTIALIYDWEDSHLADGIADHRLQAHDRVLQSDVVGHPLAKARERDDGRKASGRGGVDRFFDLRLAHGVVLGVAPAF